MRTRTTGVVLHKGKYQVWFERRYVGQYDSQQVAEDVLTIKKALPKRMAELKERRERENSHNVAP